MADIEVLKQNYRLLARIKAGDMLAAQLTWLEARFLAHADDGDAGAAEVVGTGFKGQTASFQFRGSTPEERTHALRLAIAEVAAALTADTGGVDAPVFGGILIPRVITAPR